MRAIRGADGFGSLARSPFSVPEFLARPLVAHLGTAGAVVRPVWFLWEDDIFWVLTGTWSRLASRLAADPTFELVVDSCDLATGEIRQVIGRGTGSVVPVDAGRAARKLVRYLGPDTAAWDARFLVDGDSNARGVRWARLVPDLLQVHDQSYQASSELRPHRAAATEWRRDAG